MPSVETIKMEDRKRSALDNMDHSAPPPKRQAVVNGSREHPDTDMPWRADIEEFTKDAALRQMREYKRLAHDMEAQLADLKQRGQYHDEHIRVIDQWTTQLLEEVDLFINNAAQSLSSSPGQLGFPSSLLTSENDLFEKHLRDRGEQIKVTIRKLFSAHPASSPDVASLQERIAALLKAEKKHTIELQRITVERDQTSERLETAVHRYMVAEKKVDRARSQQVQKLEQQAMASARAPVESGGATDSPTVANPETPGEPNGTSVSTAALEALEVARNEAEAVAAKRLEQMEKLTEDYNRALKEKGEAETRLQNLGDREFAASDLYKQLRLEVENTVKRANDLIATNTQLREEAKQLHSERTVYRDEVDNELRNSTLEMEEAVAQRDADLARIRKVRDTLESDFKVLQAAQDQHKVTSQQLKEGIEAHEARIGVLETEISRLQDRSPADATNVVVDGDLESLKQRIANLERDKGVLEGELKSMESAYKRITASASKKWADNLEAEVKISRLSQEKAKADQKYFSTMKVNQVLRDELRALKNSQSQSADIITRFKEAENNYRTARITYEKELAEAKDIIASLELQLRETQSKEAERFAIQKRLETQILDVKKILDAKEAVLQSSADARRTAEAETERLRVRLADRERSLETLRRRDASTQSEEYQMLRAVALCTVCRKNFKDTALKTCGHVFCQECIESRLENRMRKCPNCNKAFGNSDSMRVTL